MNLALRINLFFFYNYIGCDEFGNKYYQQKKSQNNIKKKRMVDYKGINEASKVPAKYHGWLHHYSDDFPITNKIKHKWQKQHLPNLSGTKYAYEPKKLNQGFENSNKDREYTSWSPKE